MRKIILASGSPRRKQLLEQAELDFLVRTAQTDESFPAGMAAEEAPLHIARNKAKAVRPACSPDDIILAADTVVILDGKVIGKPADEQEAFSILSSLSGRMHRVVTGVCILKGSGERTFSDTTEVWFRPLSPGRIRHYISRYKPYDKAGAYAIQEWIGLVGIEKINGDYFNVMGLPVGRVLEALA